MSHASWRVKIESIMNLARNAARATMKSNAHRRSLGTVTLDPVAPTIQQA